MYIEILFLRVNGDKVRFRFIGFDSGVFCLKFFYYMFGKLVGILNVYSGSKNVFIKLGS